MMIFRKKRSLSRQGNRNPVLGFSHKLLLPMFIVLATAATLIVSGSPVEAKTYNEMTPKERALSWSYVKTMESCMNHSSITWLKGYVDGANNDRISDRHAKNYQFWLKNDIAGVQGGPRASGVSYLGSEKVDGLNKNNEVWCGSSGDSQTQWLKNALELWGWKSPVDFLCGTSGKEGIGAYRTDRRACEESTANFVAPLDTANFLRVVKKEVYGGKDIGMGSAGEYKYNLGTFYQSCNAGSSSPSDTTTRDDSFFGNVKVVNADGKIVETNFYSTNKKKSDRIEYKPGQTITCQQLVDRINGGGGAADYANWVIANPDEAAKEGEAGEDGQKTTCAIDGIGWLLCPTINFLAGVADSAFGFLADNFLQIQVGLYDTGSSTHTAWAQVRNLANVVMVAGFLFIIFSQMTGAGISNYGIKKMLPKIIILALLINLSFIITQLAIDLSNVAGYSVQKVLFNISPADNGGVYQSSWTSGDGFAGIAGTILAGTLAGGGAVVLAGGPMLALVALIGVLLPAIFSLFVVFIILIARKVLVVLLVVLAPLAFAATILPGTDKLFQWWKKAFIGLLLIFPIVGLLFGGASLASDILSTSLATENTTINNVLAQIIAAAAQTLPLFLVWPFLKKSLDGVLGGGLMGAFHKGTSALRSKGADLAKNSSVGKGISNAVGHRRRERDIKLAKRRSKTTGFRGRVNRGYDALGGDKYNQRRSAEGYALEQKEIDEAVEQKKIEMENILGPAGILGKNLEVDDVNGGFRDAAGNRVDLSSVSAKNGGAAGMLFRALENNDAASAKAATQLLKAQRGKGRAQIREVARAYQQKHAQTDDNGNITDGVSEAYAAMQTQLSGMKQSDNVLDNLGYSNRTVDSIETDPGTINPLTYQEIATQPPQDIARGVANGTITSSMASDMLSSDTVELTAAKRSILQQAVSGSGTNSSSSPSGPGGSGSSPSSGSGSSSGSSSSTGPKGGSSQGTTNPGDSGSLSIPRGSAPQAPATAQEAKDLINQANSAQSPQRGSVIVDAGPNTPLTPSEQRRVDAAHSNNPIFRE